MIKNEDDPVLVGHLAFGLVHECSAAQSTVPADPTVKESSHETPMPRELEQDTGLLETERSPVGEHRG